MKGRILIIAGSDPSGGAGVQADIKTVTALGGYAATAITALTVQNTLGVKSVYPVAPDVIRKQIDAVVEDIGVDAVKIGMIGERDAAAVVADALAEIGQAGAPIVLDPVLRATSGGALAADGVGAMLLNDLAPHAAVITPNLDELFALAALAGLNNAQGDPIALAGLLQAERGLGPILVKGGHGDGNILTDALVVEGDVTRFSHARQETTSTHGTGCTLASAIATSLAQGMPLEASTKRAIDFVQKAIVTAPGFGTGAGPLNHTHTLSRDYD